MTKKSHQKFWRMKLKKFFRKRVTFLKIFSESENFSKIGGNLKQGRKCIMVSGGWTPLILYYIILFYSILYYSMLFYSLLCYIFLFIVYYRPIIPSFLFAWARAGSAFE